MSAPIDDGGPAFSAGDPLKSQYPQRGMSLRAWLAGQAMRTLRRRDYIEDVAGMAQECLRRADALIAELKKEPK